MGLKRGGKAQIKEAKGTRSYKDMEFGGGGGLGRLAKIGIQEHK
jgi:hypothetical protein